VPERNKLYVLIQGKNLFLLRFLFLSLGLFIIRLFRLFMYVFMCVFMYLFAYSA